MHETQGASGRLHLHTPRGAHPGRRPGPAALRPRHPTQAARHRVRLRRRLHRYTDPGAGSLYLIHRYYDPTTDQFLTIDPALDITGQPYSYADNDPINLTDPEGEICFSWHCVKHDISAVSKVVHTVSEVVSSVAGACALVAGLSIVGNAGVSEVCDAVALAASGVQFATGTINYATGQEKGGQLLLDALSFGLSGAGYAASAGGTFLRESADAWQVMAEGSSGLRAFYYGTRGSLTGALAQGLKLDSYLIGVPSTVWGALSSYGDISAELRSALCQR